MKNYYLMYLLNSPIDEFAIQRPFTGSLSDTLLTLTFNLNI